MLALRRRDIPRNSPAAPRRCRESSSTRCSTRGDSLPAASATSRCPSRLVWNDDAGVTSCSASHSIRCPLGFPGVRKDPRPQQAPTDEESRARSTRPRLASRKLCTGSRVCALSAALAHVHHRPALAVSKARRTLVAIRIGPPPRRARQSEPLFGPLAELDPDAEPREPPRAIKEKRIIEQKRDTALLCVELKRSAAAARAQVPRAQVPRTDRRQFGVDSPVPSASPARSRSSTPGPCSRNRVCISYPREKDVTRLGLGNWKGMSPLFTECPGARQGRGGSRDPRRRDG